MKSLRKLTGVIAISKILKENMYSKLKIKLVLEIVKSKQLK